MENCYCKAAGAGKHFVLTENGYKCTPDKVKPERAAGSPIIGFEYKVPISWIEKDYVEEVEMKGEKHGEINNT